MDYQIQPSWINLQLRKLRLPSQRSTSSQHDIQKRRTIHSLVQPTRQPKTQHQVQFLRCKSPTLHSLQYYLRADLTKQWARASAAQTDCNLIFYLSNSPNDLSFLKIMASIPPGLLGPSWREATGFYDSGVGGNVFFSVRLTCNNLSSQTYYVDDLSLVPA